MPNGCRTVINADTSITDCRPPLAIIIRDYRRSSELRKHVSVRRISNPPSDPVRLYSSTDALRMYARARPSRLIEIKGRNTETRLGGVNALRRTKTGRRKEIMQMWKRGRRGHRQTVKIEFLRPCREFSRVALTQPILENAVWYNNGDNGIPRWFVDLANLYFLDFKISSYLNSFLSLSLSLYLCYTLLKVSFL